MEINIDTIITIVSLLLGSGGGAFFTWRYQRKKARAEAKEAEAIAEKARIESAQANTQLIKDIQESYQKLAEDLKRNLDTQQEYNEEQKQYIKELKEDRKHLRDERDELRTQLEKLTRDMNEWRQESDEKIRTLQTQVARQGRMVECMRPLLCGREGCAIRVPVTINPTGEIERHGDGTASAPAPLDDIKPLKVEHL